jgi:hypothetical protein
LEQGCGNDYTVDLNSGGRSSNLCRLFRLGLFEFSSVHAG